MYTISPINRGARDRRIPRWSDLWLIEIKNHNSTSTTRREFLREILYKNKAIIAMQHSKMYFVDNFGDFSHTVEWNSLKSVWQISLYIY